MVVARICRREVLTVRPGDTIRAAAERMADCRVGTVVVADDSNVPVGILTDRDIVLRTVAAGRDPGATTVGEVMTTRLETVTEETPIEDAIALLRNGGFRRLPVVDRLGRLVGLLSLDDVVILLAEEVGGIGALLHKQVAETPSMRGDLPEPRPRRGARELPERSHERVPSKRTIPRKVHGVGGQAR